MRKKQKNIIQGSVVCILCLGLVGGIAFGFKKSEQNYSEKNTQTEDIKTTEVVSNQGEQKTTPKKQIPSEPIKTQEVSSTALFKIASSTVEISIGEKTSVYDAMKQLASEGKMTFDGREYPGLGFFVTQIDSLKSGDGKNLMYYINGKEASLGVSSYIMKEGDIIEWKLK